MLLEHLVPLLRSEAARAANRASNKALRKAKEERRRGSLKGGRGETEARMSQILMRRKRQKWRKSETMTVASPRMPLQRRTGWRAVTLPNNRWARPWA